MTMQAMPYEALERLYHWFVGWQRKNSTPYGAYMVQFLYRKMEEVAYVR